MQIQQEEEPVMAFVNEKVSDEDVKKYDFEGLSKTLHKDLSNLKYKWTIDRDKNIFLVWLGSGREEFFMQNRFLLWWDGQVITISLNGLGEGDPFGKTSTTWDSLLFALPEGFEPTREEVVATLKDALTVFKWAGYGGQKVDHTAIFNF